MKKAEFTKEMSATDLAMIHMLIPVLSNSIGIANALSNKDLIYVLRTAGFKPNERRIRVFIHHIRINYFVKNLIANEKGYYVATMYKEITAYMKKLKENEKSLREIRETFENPVLFM